MQLSCFYLLSTLRIMHVILDTCTRPSHFSREYNGWSLGTRLQLFYGDCLVYMCICPNDTCNRASVFLFAIVEGGVVGSLGNQATPIV